jgi:hypothetical protein
MVKKLTIVMTVDRESIQVHIENPNKFSTIEMLGLIEYLKLTYNKTRLESETF